MLSIKTVLPQTVLLLVFLAGAPHALRLVHYACTPDIVGACFGLESVEDVPPVVTLAGFRLARDGLDHGGLLELCYLWEHSKDQTCGYRCLNDSYAVCIYLADKTYLCAECESDNTCQSWNTDDACPYSPW